jgi:hypothetical protein
MNRLWATLCAVFSLIALAPTQAQQPAFLTNGLVAYYPFNGDGNDSSYFKANVLNYSDLRFSQDRFGNLNSAFESNKGNVVNIPNKQLPSGREDRTLSLWLNVSNYPSGLGTFWWAGSQSFVSLR